MNNEPSVQEKSPPHLAHCSCAADLKRAEVLAQSYEEAIKYALEGWPDAQGVLRAALDGQRAAVA